MKKLQVITKETAEGALVEEAKPNCAACAHSGMGPDDPHLICGHRDAGPLGVYVTHPFERPAPHCVDYSKFEQHSGRNPDGSLKALDSGPGWPKQ